MSSARRGTLPSPRALVRAAAALVAAPLLAALGAQPVTTITFDDLEPPPGMVWQSLGAEYVIDGYRFGCTNSNTGTVCSSLGIVGAGSPAYPGSPAFFNNNLFGITEIARADGLAFDLLSIAASPFSEQLAGTLLFEGLLADGSMVSQTFALTGAPGSPVTYAFSDEFRGLAWIRFGGDVSVSAAPVLDEITLQLSTTSVVPEPATVTLLGGGLLALGGIAAARRRR